MIFKKVQSQKEPTIQSSPNNILPQRPAELFQMKVLSLLNQHGIASNPEARDLVKRSPIKTNIEGPDGARCTLSQTLSLFPGQTIVVIGSSSLDPKTNVIHRIFPETFSISLQSSQTAFPHSSQRAGWSLVDVLIPDSPQRVDLLGDSAELFRRKDDVKMGLQPDGHFIGKAKRLLRLKRRVFAAHKSEFINLHQQLMLAILKAAPQEWRAQDAEEHVKAWFKELSAQSCTYDILAEANQLCGEQFISASHCKLKEAIITGKDTAFGSNDPLVRRQAAKDVLEDVVVTHGPIEACKQNYVAVMGALFGRASHAIILQHLSEDLVFPPIPLSPFEQKLQQAAYRHLQDFTDELILHKEGSEGENLTWCREYLANLIKADIAIFEGKGDKKIATELATYFIIRYNSLNA